MMMSNCLRPCKVESVHNDYGTPEPDIMASAAVGTLSMCTLPRTIVVVSSSIHQGYRGEERLGDLPQPGPGDSLRD